MAQPSVLDGLTAEDRKAYALSLQLDDYEKRAIYEELLLEKWSKVPTRDGGTFDWLGSDSEDLGYPKINSRKEKVNIAMLMDNQLRFNRSKRLRVDKRGYISNPSILADTSTADEALPTTFALAMVRRAYAIMQTEDWSSRQPMPGPTSFVWWIDFIREADTTNLLSNESGAFLTAEAGVPNKSKISLNRALVTATKQLMGTTWTLEASEDAMAQLGMNIEQEMISEFTAEFVRNRFHQHLGSILFATTNTAPTGQNLPGLWANTQTAHAIPASMGSANVTTLQDWARAIFNALVDADKFYVALNRRTADGIVCGLDLAALLQKAITATQSGNPGPVMDNDVGITDYGTFSGRFHVWGTDLLPPNQGFLYKRNADTLRSGHIYAPYVPIQAMPAVYGGYTAGAGNGQYTNTDEYTRNIRERSAEIVVKPYAFVPLVML